MAMRSKHRPLARPAHRSTCPHPELEVGLPTAGNNQLVGIESRTRPGSRGWCEDKVCAGRRERDLSRGERQPAGLGEIDKARLGMDAGVDDAPDLDAGVMQSEREPVTVVALRYEQRGAPASDAVAFGEVVSVDRGADGGLTIAGKDRQA